MSLRRTDINDVFNHVSAHSGEKETAQKWIDANLAGASNFGKKGDDSSAKLAQVAGEFIGARQILEFSAAREDVESKFRQRDKEADQIFPPISAVACSV